jgi:hypothetical protein
VCGGHSASENAVGADVSPYVDEQILPAKKMEEERHVLERMQARINGASQPGLAPMNQDARAVDPGVDDPARH